MPKVIKKILRLVTIKNITKCTRNEVAAAVGVDPSAVTRMFKRGFNLGHSIFERGGQFKAGGG